MRSNLNLYLSYNLKPCLRLKIILDLNVNHLKHIRCILNLKFHLFNNTIQLRFAKMIYNLQ